MSSPPGNRRPRFGIRVAGFPIEIGQRLGKMDHVLTCPTGDLQHETVVRQTRRRTVKIGSLFRSAAGAVWRSVTLTTSRPLLALGCRNRCRSISPTISHFRSAHDEPDFYARHAIELTSTVRSISHRASARVDARCPSVRRPVQKQLLGRGGFGADVCSSMLRLRKKLQQEAWSCGKIRTRTATPAIPARGASGSTSRPGSDPCQPFFHSAPWSTRSSSNHCSEQRLPLEPEWKELNAAARLSRYGQKRRIGSLAIATTRGL